MPVEIREIVIKTVVQTQESNGKRGMTSENIGAIKRELMEECKRLINQQNKKARTKR